MKHCHPAIDAAIPVREHRQNSGQRIRKTTDQAAAARCSALLLLLVIQSFTAGSGCIRSGGNPGDPLRSSNGSTVTPPSVIHDAGSVLAGTPIRHTFQFRNRTNGPLHLDSDDGIRMSCGCTAADVRSRHLAPGDATPIEVQLNTSAKRGDVTEVVSTTWTADDQSIEEYTFQIRARIQTALNLSPTEVIFSRDDVDHGKRKNIECTSELDLDWSKANIVPLADGLVIRRRRILENGLTFDLSINPADERLDQIRKSAIRVSVPGQGVESTEAGQASESLPVYLPSLGSTRIAPSLVTFYSSSEPTVWRGWFIVTGDTLKKSAEGESVQILEASSARIEFRERRLAPTAIRVDATLTATGSDSDEPPAWIDIVLTSGERKRLRIRCSQKRNSKET